MKKYFFLFFILFFCGALIYADGINPLKNIQHKATTTQNISVTSTQITRTHDGFVSVFPIDGDIRINLSGTANATYDPLIEEGSYFTSPYLMTDGTLNAISASGVTVSITVIIENY